MYLLGYAGIVVKLTALTLTNFRNFLHYELAPTDKFNLIVGANGQGKTSLLEALYFLGFNRSFRNRSHQPVIHHQQSFCQIVGQLVSDEGGVVTIGIEKQQNATKSQLKISGSESSGSSELAQCLPIQLIHHETFHLLDAGPKHRRAFLDWGVFYAEPLYFDAWQRFQRALKQRNVLLKNLDSDQLDFWEQEIAVHGALLEQYRRLYLTLLLPVLDEVLQQVSLPAGLDIQYHSGWDVQQDYLKILQHSRQRDAILGHTQYGPHRADIRIRVNQHDADHILSRGQQKMLSFALRVAQALLLSRLTQKRCLFLVDDLAAELDSNHIGIACAMLDQLPCQIFITAVHQSLLKDACAQYGMSMFHVEHC